jgi:hypothetical protein
MILQSLHALIMVSLMMMMISSSSSSSSFVVVVAQQQEQQQSTTNCHYPTIIPPPTPKPSFARRKSLLSTSIINMNNLSMTSNSIINSDLTSTIASNNMDATTNTLIVSSKININHSIVFPSSLSTINTTNSTVIRRIHCGGRKPYIDDMGNLWEADTLNQFYNRGMLYTNFTINISHTKNDVLYQTERTAKRIVIYTIPVPVPNAMYSIELHFAEIFWYQPNQRLFDIL